MRKGSFNLSVHDYHGNRSTETVNGYVSSLFGYSKNIHKNYIVTHLGTGFTIANFPKARQAKQFVELIESEKGFPIPWNKVTLENVKDIGPNASLTFELISKVNK